MGGAFFVRMEVMEWKEEIYLKVKRYFEADGGVNKVLLLDASEILKNKLLAVLPDTEFFCLSQDDEKMLLNMSEENLTTSFEQIFEGECFQKIYAGRSLEKAIYPEALLRCLRKRLATNGNVMYIVGNIQHHSAWGALLQGRWYCQNTDIFQQDNLHYYSIQDIVTLLKENLYEDVVVDTIVKACPDNRREKMVKCGFVSDSNGQNILDTLFWIVEAGRYDEAGVMLRSKYDEATRKVLARLLHRIENDLDIEENTDLLWQLCEEKGIDFAYLDAFIKNAMVFPKHTLQNIANQLQEDEADG